MCLYSRCMYICIQLRIRETVGSNCKRPPGMDNQHRKTHTSTRNSALSHRHIKKNNVEQGHDQTNHLGLETNATYFPDVCLGEQRIHIRTANEGLAYITIGFFVYYTCVYIYIYKAGVVARLQI